MDLQMVGCGKMGQALLTGLIGASTAAEMVHVVEPSFDVREQISRDFPGVTVSEKAEAGIDTILAVKPHLAVEVAAGLPPIPRLLSVAAGITTGALEAVTDAAIVRCMPNTPALLGQGAAGVAIGTSASPTDLEWGLQILSAAGVAVAVSEDQLDAVTGLSGSGPAYVFRMAEAMTRAGIAAGLPSETARTLTYQTIAGAGAMLATTDADAATLRTNVTTPRGTTAAGLAVMDERDIDQMMIAAVAKAAERSREMGAS